MTYTTHLVADHTIHLDPINGAGLMVMPLPSDIRIGHGPGEDLDAARWDQAVNWLGMHGWEPLEDEFGGPLSEGVTPDGRQVVALYLEDCITSSPSLTEIGASVSELRSVVGLALSAG